LIVAVPSILIGKFATVSDTPLLTVREEYSAGEVSVVLPLIVTEPVPPEP
jgi:hypothetical protein